MNLANVLTAELAKVRTLPFTTLTALGTVLLGVIITAALAANASERGVAMTAGDAVTQAVPFAQVGIILLGILPAGHEYSGSQYRTSLVAVPNRTLFFAGKWLSAVIALAATAIVTTSLSLASAFITQQAMDAPGINTDSPTQPQGWILAGAAAYLTLIGLLSHAVAVLVRNRVPALVIMLVLVLLVPPLARNTGFSRWLPSRAGETLFSAGDADLTAVTGALVLCAWIIAVGAAAYISLRARDT
ncbi:ABC transporter permease [Leucobacter insecticola]|uniref:ABC transporter permease n=1 Tax=Leucobacter insecticola TaxID=2714934 RepID=A0A6G8FKL7_9MICO|nr:ABC transporter permease [Leucobacter insecticola]QIM16907.1 ABC transporter permease [Leucobacter insecticola]